MIHSSLSQAHIYNCRNEKSISCEIEDFVFFVTPFHFTS